jgi:hypothetical protein
MGMLYSQVEYLVKQCVKHNISGRLITLGRLDYYITYEQFQSLMVEVNLARWSEQKLQFLNPETDRNIERIIQAGAHINQKFSNTRLCSKPCISDNLLYTGLGFRRFDSIDISPRHGRPSITFDLNQQEITKVIDEPYDLTIDAGVMEHVFDVGQVFTHMTNLTKVGGHIMHIAPGNNTFDHGFYQFSPTLFRDYYLKNKFIINDISVLGLSKNAYASKDDDFIDRWDHYRLWCYDPEEFSRNSFGQLTNDIYFTCVFVCRDIISTCGIPPTQYLFQDPRPPYPGPW